MYLVSMWAQASLPVFLVRYRCKETYSIYPPREAGDPCNPPPQHIDACHDKILYILLDGPNFTWMVLSERAMSWYNTLKVDFHSPILQFMVITWAGNNARRPLHPRCRGGRIKFTFIQRILYRLQGKICLIYSTERTISELGGGGKDCRLRC